MKRTFCVQNTKRSNIDFNHMPSFYKVLDIRLPLPLLFFARSFNQLEPFPMILHLHFMIFGHDRQFRFPFLVIADRLLSFILCFFFRFCKHAYYFAPVDRFNSIRITFDFYLFQMDAVYTYGELIPI